MYFPVNIVGIFFALNKIIICLDFYLVRATLFVNVIQTNNYSYIFTYVQPHLISNDNQ